MSNSDFPVGFAYVASALLHAGHEVFGSNPNNDASFPSGYEMVYDKIRVSLRKSRPELIGVGGLCTDYAFLKDAIHIIRMLAPGVPIVCGGGIINHDADFIFRTLRPDFCIIGEAEERIVQLAGVLDSENRDFEQIPNLGYWKEGVPKFTKQDFNYPDINTRSFPDYEPFGVGEMLDNFSLASRYFYRYTRANPRHMTIVTARGCPFNCSFCVHQKDSRYRARTIENVTQEIAFLYERYKFNILIILDELFAANPERLTDFCQALLKGRKTLGWDFDWIFQTHASASISEVNMRLAKEAGCYCFSYGLESASPRVLESMNKKTKPSQIVAALERAHAEKIGFAGNFIFGDVAETTETVLESMKFFFQYCLDDHIYLTSVQPYPGSRLFEVYQNMGLIRDKLAYYEHIDEDVVLNKVSIPGRVWRPWIRKICYLGNITFPWARSVDAYRYAQEPKEGSTPLFAHTKKTIWNIWATCPHCSKEIYYREPLTVEPFKKAALEQKMPKSQGSRNFFSRIAESYCGISSQAGFLKRLFIFARKALRYAIRKTEWFLVISRHPLFRLFEHSYISDNGQSSIFFITGCPFCNKRLKVNIPVRRSGHILQS